MEEQRLLKYNNMKKMLEVMNSYIKSQNNSKSKDFQIFLKRRINDVRTYFNDMFPDQQSKYQYIIEKLDKILIDNIKYSDSLGEILIESSKDKNVKYPDNRELEVKIKKEEKRELKLNNMNKMLEVLNSFIKSHNNSNSNDYQKFLKRRIDDIKIYFKKLYPDKQTKYKYIIEKLDKIKIDDIKDSHGLGNIGQINFLKINPFLN